MWWLISNFASARPGNAVKQLGLEAALKGFGVGIIVAVAAPAHALPRPGAGEQLLKAGSRVLAALVRMDDEPRPGLAHG